MVKNMVKMYSFKNVKISKSGDARQIILPIKLYREYELEVGQEFDMILESKEEKK